jgi:ferredoxin
MTPRLNFRDRLIDPKSPDRRPRRAAYALPALFTAANLFMGFWAILKSIEGALWAQAGNQAAPRIVKCELCRHRAKDGKGPACAEVCPRDAVTAGRRGELLAEARRRLAERPDAYQPRIYGETDGGGTNVLYLSPVAFETVGLPALGSEPAPALSETIQHGIYQGFAAPLALLGALSFVTWKNGRTAKQEER